MIERMDGTLVQDGDHVVVELKRGGDLLERIVVEGLTTEQARAVARLADLWTIASADPRYQDKLLELHRHERAVLG